MAARNPGPVLNPPPLGFPSFNKRCQRDSLARKVFLVNEVNSRVYKSVMQNIGFKGPIKILNKVGPYKIRLRCLAGGYSRGIFRFTRVAKMGMQQLAKEGWLQKYGYRPGLFR